MKIGIAEHLIKLLNFLFFVIALTFKSFTKKRNKKRHYMTSIKTVRFFDRIFLKPIEIKNKIN